MSEPYIGEIRLFPYGWAPEQWVPCDGRKLPLNGYEALYSIIGITYGGDGKKDFRVPDLRGRVAVGVGANPTDAFHPLLGQAGGTDAVTLTNNQMPAHNHRLTGATIPAIRTEVSDPNGNWIGRLVLIKSPSGTEQTRSFTMDPPDTTLDAGTLSPYQGTSGPHENRQPFQVINYYIATMGEYPTRD